MCRKKFDISAKIVFYLVENLDFAVERMFDEGPINEYFVGFGEAEVVFVELHSSFRDFFPFQFHRFSKKLKNKKK